MESWRPYKKKGAIWIIGNGPSLAWTPLDELIGEATFAMNRIHLIYDDVKWRPTYYLCVDDVGTEPGMVYHESVYHSNQGYHCFFKVGWADGIEQHRQRRWPPDVTYIDQCLVHQHNIYHTPEKPKKWHFPSLCTFGTGLSPMMQLAVLMGYNPLILIGCDLGFVPIESKDHPDPNHFTEWYTTMDDWPIEDKDATLILTHEVAKRSCNEYGIEVYNATMGGILDVYPRIDFFDALERYGNERAN